MELGAMWIKTSPQGEKYMSGVIEYPGCNIPIAVFKNKNKTADNHPDYKIVWSKPNNKSGGNGAGNVGAGSPDINDDSIPF